MRFDSKTICITTAVSLIISFTITSYALATSTDTPIQALTPTATVTPTPTPALSLTPSTKPLEGATATPAVSPLNDTQASPSAIQTGEATPIPEITPSMEATPPPEITPSPGNTPNPKRVEDESLWYSKKIAMPKEHQKLLWEYCKKRKLVYIDMLALIYLESGFNQKASNGRYKGYFQLSSKNTANIAKTLKIQNKPLDGAINLNMGTALFSWILSDGRVMKFKGDKKMEVALSIFQRGTGGYESRGISNSFVKKFEAKRKIVVSYFKKADTSKLKK